MAALVLCVVSLFDSCSISFGAIGAVMACGTPAGVSGPASSGVMFDPWEQGSSPFAADVSTLGASSSGVAVDPWRRGAPGDSVPAADPPVVPGMPVGPPPGLALAPRSSSAGRRSVWLFVDFSQFSRSSGLSGAVLETAWSRFWLLGDRLGNLWGGGADGRCRVVLELEILDGWAPTVAPRHARGDDVSVREFACGDLPVPLSVVVSASRISRDSIQLAVDRGLFAACSGFDGVHLESCWSRLWCLAESRDATMLYRGVGCVLLEVRFTV